MKVTFLSCLMLMLLSGMLSAQTIQGDTWASIQEAGSGEVTVLYFEEDAFAYIDDNGTLTGVSVEIIRQFVNYINNTRNVNIRINFVEENNFSKLYRDVRDGQGGVFGIANVTITEARRQELAFSPPYLTNIAVLITHTDIPQLSSFSALSTEFGGNIGVLYTGTTHEERLLTLRQNFYPQMRTVTAVSDREVIDLIAQNPGYFGYVDLYNYWLAQRQGLPIHRHVVGDQASENFGIIMPLNSDWIPLINEFFNLGSGGYRANPAYRNILVRHLGTEVTRMLEIARRDGN